MVGNSLRYSPLASCFQNPPRPLSTQSSTFCQLRALSGISWSRSWRNYAQCASFTSKANAVSHCGRRFCGFRASFADGASVGEAEPTVSTVEESQKKVLVPIALGTEEMEAVIIIDILRRAGAHVTVASVEPSLQIEASRRVKLVADTSISMCTGETFDLVVLPADMWVLISAGGMPGSARLRDSEILQTIVRKQAENGRLYGAICAAPAVALDTWDLLKGVEVTCHPAFMYRISSLWTVESNVQRDGLVTTSRGPGTAMEFALSFVEQLYGKERSEEIEKSLVFGINEGSGLGRTEYNAVEWSVTNTPCASSACGYERTRCKLTVVKVLVPVANGSEEMEAVIIVDILRRASAHVVVASVEETLEIVGSRNVKIVADKLIEDAAVSEYDLIVLPGGMPGAERLGKSEPLVKLLRKQALSNRVHGAICASPVVVLNTHGLLQGKRATAHPSFSSKLTDQSAVDACVVIDGRLITSRGPGTAIEFSLAIVEKLYGQERARCIAEGMVFSYL